LDNSLNTHKRQPTSYEDYPDEIGLETRNNRGVSSESVGLSDKDIKSEINTETLLEEILEDKNLNKACRQVVKNKGSHGIDGMKYNELVPYLKEHGSTLIEEILSGNYKPSPVRRVEIPKPNGGIRLLGIPTVKDRMIQQAIKLKLDEKFEPTFSNNSHGFRLNRSAHTALEQSRQYIQEGNSVVVDMDLEKYFDTINHDKLMAAVKKQVKDKRILELINKYLKSGIMINGIKVKSEDGAPQGGPLSPLLSNVMLDALDKELEERGHKFVRYADDCNIYVKTLRAGKRVLKSVTQFLGKELKLKVNQEKSAVGSPFKRKFLGYSFYTRNGEVRFRVHQKSWKRLKEKIKKVTNRNISMNFQERMKKLNQLMVGWVNYYRLADMKGRLSNLDSWVRRRIRACTWKRWKRVRSRFKYLKKLGLSVIKAWQFANTRKSYWKVSNSPILTYSLTTKRLTNRGYKSFLSQYMKVRLS